MTGRWMTGRRERRLGRFPVIHRCAVRATVEIREQARRLMARKSFFFTPSRCLTLSDPREEWLATNPRKDQFSLIGTAKKTISRWVNLMQNNLNVSQARLI